MTKIKEENLEEVNEGTYGLPGPQMSQEEAIKRCTINGRGGPGQLRKCVKEYMFPPQMDEVSSMAGGSVEGYSVDPTKKKKSPTIFREEDEEEVDEQKDLIEEMILREIIFKALKKQHYDRINLAERKKQQVEDDEMQIRKVVRHLIQEAKKDIEDTPHSSTAINILEDLLKQILPNLETEFKTLTTAREQRDSFRAHVVNAVSTLLDTEDINKAGGAAGEEEGLISLDEEEGDIEEEVDIKVSDVDAPADDKFIDIEAEPQEPEEPDTFGIEGQDATGRALAQEAFNNIEKNITETYAILHDESDEKLFQDYLITNLKLYFDKWEQELGAVTEPTTDEYEAEKDEDEAGTEAGAEFDAELGGELGGEAPAAAGAGEEVV